MITVVASIASYYCAASIGIGHIFNLANHKKAVPIVGIIAFSVALFIDTPEELKVISTFTDKFTYIFIVVLPLLFLLYSVIRNKKGEQYVQKRVKLLFILCTSSLLSGCWDQEPLREARLAYSIGSDITEENKLQQTIELVKVQAESNLHSKMKYIQQRGIT